MMTYDLIVASLSTMCGVVSRKLGMGWRLHGAPFLVGERMLRPGTTDPSTYTAYAQAITKETADAAEDRDDKGQAAEAGDASGPESLEPASEDRRHLTPVAPSEGLVLADHGGRDADGGSGEPRLGDEAGECLPDSGGSGPGDSGAGGGGEVTRLGESYLSPGGYEIVSFHDAEGLLCSLHETHTSAGLAGVFLGRGGQKALLNHAQAGALIGHLKRWRDTGRLG